jgi:DNA-binding winged helix-turn-helix (wHTH) protein
MPRYCFDRFELDSDQKLLRRGDEPVRLTPRAFRLLEHLLRLHPKAVSKRELLDHVWAGTIVEEANLKTLVLEIRNALEERGGRPDSIRTAYGFGYAFTGTVNVEEGPPPVPPLITLRWSDGSVRLPAGEHLIGRASHCAVVIEAPSVSREHARLSVTRDALRLTDLGSKNGTFIGSARIEGTVDLFDLCRITIGSVEVDVSRLGRETSTETVNERAAPR